MAYRVQVPVGAHIECRLALTRHFALRRSNIKLGAIKFDQMPPSERISTRSGLPSSPLFTIKWLSISMMCMGAPLFAPLHKDTRLLSQHEAREKSGKKCLILTQQTPQFLPLSFVARDRTGIAALDYLVYLSASHLTATHTRNSKPKEQSHARR